jgi:hypothetical protein
MTHAQQTLSYLLLIIGDKVEAPGSSHEDGWMREGKTPRIIHLGIRWR